MRSTVRWLLLLRDAGHGVVVREEQAMSDLDRVLGRLARWGSPEGVLPPWASVAVLRFPSSCEFSRVTDAAL